MRALARSLVGLILLYVTLVEASLSPGVVFQVNAPMQSPESASHPSAWENESGLPVAPHPARNASSSISDPHMPCAQFEFSLSSVTPPFAFATAGTLVTLQGCNLSPPDGMELQVYFGSLLCQVASVSNEFIKCLAPASSVSSGPVRVLVKHNSATFSRFANLDAGFYWYQPKIVRAVPSSVDCLSKARIRLDVSGFYRISYTVYVDGEEVHVHSFHANYALIDLPKFVIDTKRKSVSIAIFTELPGEASKRLLVESVGALVLTSSGENASFITNCVPSWGLTTRPPDQLSLYVTNLQRNVQYNLYFGDMSSLTLSPDFDEGCLMVQVPMCVTESCVGVVDMLLIADGLEIDTWQFTYVHTPVSASTFYPGPELPCNYRHEMRISLRDFSFKVPTGLQMGRFVVSDDNDNDFYVSADGFSFILKTAMEPYASGPVALLDDAGSVVFIGSLFFHSTPIDGMMVTKTVPNSLILGFPIPITFYGFGMSELSPAYYVIADVLTPEAAAMANGSTDALFFVTNDGRSHSSITGSLHVCETDESVCKTGAFDLVAYNEKGEKLGTALSAITLQQNSAPGTSLMYRFERETSRDEVEMVLASLALVIDQGAKRRLFSGEVFRDGRFEIIVAPTAYDKPPPVEHIAQKVDEQIMDESSDIHNTFPDLSTELLERKTVYRCSDGVFRAVCVPPPSDSNRSVWLYLGIGSLLIALIAALLVYLCRRRALKRRAAMILEEQYREIND